MTASTRIDNILAQIKDGALSPAEGADLIRSARVGVGVVGLVEEWVDVGSGGGGDVSGWCVLVVCGGGEDEVVRAVAAVVGGGVVVVGADRAAGAFGDLVGEGRVPQAVVWVGGGGPGSVVDLTALVAAAHGLTDRLRLLFLGVDLPIAGVWDHAVGAWARSVALEWSGFCARVVRTDDPVRALSVELPLLATVAGVEEVRVDGRGRRVSRLREVSLDWSSRRPPVEAGGVYVITGGTGGIGGRLTEWVIAAGGRPVVVSRSGAASQWLERFSRPVTSVVADVTDREALAGALARARALGPVRGVLHAAGVLDDSLTWDKSPGGVSGVVATKAQAAVWLDQLTVADPLDFFVVFSSVSGLRGNLGQSDYAYANRALDELVVWRARRTAHPGVSVSIAWPLWQDGGMRLDPATERYMRRTGGLVPLHTTEALAILTNALCDPQRPVLAILKGDRAKITDRYLTQPTEQTEANGSAIRSEDERA